ncbi:hypothetical protein EVAR_90391_1 [Eumeta japonica]|uniref:Uncharacterized protein n=1 Tax=Eumeta variegata TaxID=151549 RepID=A0A4C1ZUD4_EUMVA|nr:hypothetical protein EVAR_90391_1 [Eumeta japonica]
MTPHLNEGLFGGLRPGYSIYGPAPSKSRPTKLTAQRTRALQPRLLRWNFRTDRVKIIEFDLTKIRIEKSQRILRPRARPPGLDRPRARRHFVFAGRRRPCPISLPRSRPLTKYTAFDTTFTTKHASMTPQILTGRPSASGAGACTRSLSHGIQKCYFSC